MLKNTRLLEFELGDFSTCFVDGYTLTALTVRNDSLLINPTSGEMFTLNSGEEYVRAAKLSLSQNHIAVLRGAKSLEIYSKDKNGWRLVEQVVNRNQFFIGFEWLKGDDIMIVSPNCIEFYSFVPSIVSKKISICVSWFFYCAVSHIVVICSKDSLSLFHLKNRQLEQLPSIFSSSSKSRLHSTFNRKDVSIITLYDRIFLSIIDCKSSAPTMFLYKISRSSVRCEAELLIGKGTEFSLIILDNLILCHNLSSKVTFIFDIKHHCRNPIVGNPILHVNFRTFLPNLILTESAETKTASLCECSLDLELFIEKMRNYSVGLSGFPSPDDLCLHLQPFFTQELQIAEFLARRSEPIKFSLLFGLCKSLMEECQRILNVYFENDFVIDGRNEFLFTKVKHFYVILHAAVDPTSSQPTVSNNSFDVIKFLFQPLRVEKAVSNAFLLQAMIHYYSIVVKDKSISQRHFDFIRSLLLEEENVGSYINQFIQFRLFDDSQIAAAQLIKYEKVWKLGMDMYKRMYSHEIVILELLNRNMVLQALKYALSKNHISKIPPALFLDAAYSDRSVFCVVYKCLDEEGLLDGSLTPIERYVSIYLESWGTSINMEPL